MYQQDIIHWHQLLKLNYYELLTTCNIIFIINTMLWNVRGFNFAFVDVMNKFSGTLCIFTYTMKAYAKLIDLA